MLHLYQPQEGASNGLLKCGVQPSIQSAVAP